MPEQNPTCAEGHILKKLRLRNARSSLLQILGTRQRHLESLALAREMALPSCSLIVMSYDSGKPKFLLLYKKHGGRALGPSGTVEDGESPRESLLRISHSQLGLEAAGLNTVSDSYAQICSNGRECHMFVLVVPLQKLRDMAGEVNSGRHPDFMLGCVAGADEVLAASASLNHIHSQFAQGIARADRISA
ncbi:MAG: hypothetical protein PHQ80_04210 [Candidatus ainarchaeum sp.]|nr:hypothetical protein [Candidatus ainarchaeum sp.]MDD5096639.1 hypothetical protein [Candidatus ainarchaeum sp.]